MPRHTDVEHGPDSSRDWWPVPMFPLWRSLGEMLRDDQGRRMIAVEEYTEDNTLVVRAELPGIDPAKDVEITIVGGMLHIKAERTERKEQQGHLFHRRELRYGSFARSISIPAGVAESQIAATYKDGILEVRLPLPESHKVAAPRRIPVSRG